MAGDKRYYWLKLYDDFFSSLRIKKLRKMAGGDTYVIIYLKLQLKAMKSNGIIKFDGVEQSIAEEIALDIDEEIDNVRITLAYLVSCGLAETNGDSSMFFPYAVANVGSEGSSAQRVREYRERSKVSETKALPAKTNAERQRSFRAKKMCEEKQHIPMVDDHTNSKRYGGNYFLVCQRESYKCAVCGGIENLCVHHIDGYDENHPENNALNKMILLCRACHSNVHAGTPIPQDVLDRVGYDSNDVTCNALCNAGETPVKRIGNGEKEIEKEIDIERESSSYGIEGIGDADALQNVTAGVTKNNESDDAADDLIKPDPLCVYAANQLRISPTGMDELVSFRDSLPDDLIKYAIDRAIDLGSRNYAYVRKILSGYVEAGFKTVGEAKAAEAKKSAKAKFDDGYDNSGIYW